MVNNAQVFNMIIYCMSEVVHYRMKMNNCVFCLFVFSQKRSRATNFPYI